jgi:hypothetical protein
MFELTLVQLDEPIRDGMGVWQIRDGQHVLGHLVASREAFEPIFDGLVLLAAANQTAKRGFSVVPFEPREQPLLGQEPYDPARTIEALNEGDPL